MTLKMDGVFILGRELWPGIFLLGGFRMAVLEEKYWMEFFGRGFRMGFLDGDLGLELWSGIIELGFLEIIEPWNFGWKF